MVANQPLLQVDTWHQAQDRGRSPWTCGASTAQRAGERQIGFDRLRNVGWPSGSMDGWPGKCREQLAWLVRRPCLPVTREIYIRNLGMTRRGVRVGVMFRPTGSLPARARHAGRYPLVPGRRSPRRRPSCPGGGADAASVRTPRCSSARASCLVCCSSSAGSAMAPISGHA